MIRYPTRTAVIERLVRKRKPTWQAKATQRTQFHQMAGRYIKRDEVLPNGKKANEFWRDVKSVFVTVQYGKCAYCEAKPESSAIQWDVEHFRPKSDVAEWVYDNFPPTGPAMPEGYYLLAYDLGNYAASCKTCNTEYKRSYFPIEHDRVVHGQSIAAHLSEGAYLIYPLGDQAEDPEQHITFEDVQAVAKNGSARGQLIIDFFQLNREGLQRSRAEWLVHTFWNAFEGFVEGKPKAVKTMKWLLSHEASYTNCTRSFLDLCQTDILEAEKRYVKMQKILQKTPMR